MLIAPRETLNCVLDWLPGIRAQSLVFKLKPRARLFVWVINVQPNCSAGQENVIFVAVTDHVKFGGVMFGGAATMVRLTGLDVQERPEVSVATAFRRKLP